MVHSTTTPANPPPSSSVSSGQQPPPASVASPSSLDASGSATPATAEPAQPARSGMWFPLILVGIAAIYFAYVGYRLVYPPQIPGVDVKQVGFLARCREICERYGLLPTGNIARDAEAFLEVAQTNKLEDSLDAILADKDFQPQASQPHPLVGQPAPNFELLDTKRIKQTLNGLRGDRPMIVVFYYGYWCNHCVAQLFGLDKDLRYFQELGADVVAISADLPEHTAEKYREYGEFHFPVLSDPDNRVAESFGVFRPAKDGEPELLDHGTFVIDRSGKIVWANQGPEPFVDNKTLLFELKRAE